FWAGLGRVASSLTLAILGLSLGHGAARLAGVEAGRGRAGPARPGALGRGWTEAGRGCCGPYALVAFGCADGLWGVRRAIVRREGLVAHEHGGTVHLHRGGHVRHTHPSAPATFWALFAIFVLGPCEPLIPLFVLPASRGMWALAGWTALVFSIVTVAAMMALVALASAGVARLPWG